MNASAWDAPSPNDRLTTGCFALPAFGIVMKVGPHSGMSLAQIAESKRAEEAIGGVHYWGYSGTSCHPSRVRSFVLDVLARQAAAPVLLLLETRSGYTSPIGRIGRFSTDAGTYGAFDGPVQLQGAQYAFVCRNLRRMDCSFPADSYSVVGGTNDGALLSRHLRYRVSKAFVRRNEVVVSAQQARLAYAAELAEPYVIWLET
jgi:hypothetical protein